MLDKKAAWPNAEDAPVVRGWEIAERIIAKLPAEHPATMLAAAMGNSAGEGYHTWEQYELAMQWLAQHVADGASTEQASSTAELATRSGALEPEETTDGRERKG